jgi:hypothetical protein
MDSCRIHYLFGIGGDRLLLVFHTNRRGYEFRVARSTGEVSGDPSIFYTADAALEEGRRWLGNG